VTAFHSLIVLSSETDASCLPSGEKVTAFTEYEWPSSVCNIAPVTASHSLIVLSSEADANCLPSGEKATAFTESEWPSSVCNIAPVTASHSLIVLSSETDASCLPSGEKATASTEYEWPSSVCSKVLQLFCTFGPRFIHRGILSTNCLLTMLITGVKTSALLYICNGAFSIANRLYCANRLIS
jgi:hypothetical protein